MQISTPDLRAAQNYAEGLLPERMQGREVDQRRRESVMTTIEGRLRLPRPVVNEPSAATLTQW